MSREKNMDKRTKLACLTIPILIVLLALPASTQETVVSIADIEAEYSSTVAVPLMIKNVTNLGGGEVNVTYNPSIVRVINVSKGNMTLGAYNINNASGWVYINAFSAEGQSGDVIFAYIHFTTVGSETEISALNITIYELFNTNYYNISHTVINGTFTVKPTLTPTPTPSTGGGGGGGGYVPLTTPTPKPTEKPPAIPGEDTPSPTPTPIITPSATPTQTPAPTTTPAPLPVIRWFIIMIAIVASAVFISAFYYYHRRMQREK